MAANTDFSHTDIQFCIITFTTLRSHSYIIVAFELHIIYTIPFYNEKSAFSCRNSQLSLNLNPSRDVTLSDCPDGEEEELRIPANAGTDGQLTLHGCQYIT